MTESDIADRIVDKARTFGAHLAGITGMEQIESSPSYRIFGKLDQYDGVGSKRSDGNESKPKITG